jgi:alpha-ketoglutarate-dependent 2,4-dichlorophenoxyacetate dioxygenase
MAISVKPLHPLFGAGIGQVDTGRPVEEAMFAEIRAAFEEYSLLLFRDQELDDDRRIAFSRRFGPLETTVKANPAGGTYFARQSNLDIDTGAVIPPEDRRITYQKANMFWHTDSSFKRVPALCSLLSARLVPREGGDTEFATMHATYAELPEATQRRIEGLIAEHSLVHSRSLVDPRVLTEDQKDEVPPVPQTLVRTNPVNGRKSLYVSAHASHIIGWPVE